MPAVEWPGIPTSNGDSPSGLSDREFEVFRELVSTRTGIALGPHKRALLQARLSRRLRALGLATFTDYHRYLMDEDVGGTEMARFVSAITTNKTDFFREPHHFAYLSRSWIPRLRARLARTPTVPVRLWSAGCSTGEEPYSIAMTLLDGLGASDGLDLRILASDIDESALERATRAIYALDDARLVPRDALPRHFLKGVGANAGLVQVRPAVRELVTFRRINLLDRGWPIRIRFDAIFCRNVLIYFDRPTQQRVLSHLVEVLAEGGLLVLGHSETPHGLVGGLRPLGQTIFERTEESARWQPS